MITAPQAGAAAYKRGDFVQTQFDTGAMGYSTLLGRVVAAGPLTATIVWESGLRNRIRHTHRSVKPIVEAKAREMWRGIAVPGDS